MCDDAVVFKIKGPHQEIVNSKDLAAISELVLPEDWQGP